MLLAMWHPRHSPSAALQSRDSWVKWWTSTSGTVVLSHRALGRLNHRSTATSVIPFIWICWFVLRWSPLWCRPACVYIATGQIAQLVFSCMWCQLNEDFHVPFIIIMFPLVQLMSDLSSSAVKHLWSRSLPVLHQCLCSVKVNSIPMDYNMYKLPPSFSC